MITCRQCNSIRTPGKPCKTCAALYQRRHREKVDIGSIKPVFKRAKTIKLGRLFEIFDRVNGELLLSGLFDTAQEAYESWRLRTGRPLPLPALSGCYSDCEEVRAEATRDMPADDSWIEDESIYVRAASL